MKSKFFMGMLSGTLAFSCIGGAGCSQAAEFTKQILNSVQFPDSYYIEYEIVNEDGTVDYIGKGVDGQGNYRYKTSERETLYLKEGNNYETYELSGGIWIDKNMPVKFSYVKEETKAFDDYAKKSMEKFNGSYKKSEEKVTYLGKTCDPYILTLHIGETFQQSYEMLVEEKTGICMRYFAYTNVGGVETDASGFECIEYKTQGLDFISVLE